MGVSPWSLMSKLFEEHLADWILRYREPEHLPYRRACMALWRTTYGEQTVAKVEKLVKGQWKK